MIPRGAVGLIGTIGSPNGEQHLYFSGAPLRSVSRSGFRSTGGRRSGKRDLIRRATFLTRCVVGRDNAVIRLPGYQIRKSVGRHISHIDKSRVVPPGGKTAMQTVALDAPILRLIPRQSEGSGRNRRRISESCGLRETGNE